jgi:hypothetical protein
MHNFWGNIIKTLLVCQRRHNYCLRLHDVLFCACDVMNVLFVKKMKIYKKKVKKRKEKKSEQFSMLR